MKEAIEETIMKLEVVDAIVQSSNLVSWDFDLGFRMISWIFDSSVSAPAVAGDVAVACRRSRQIL